MKIVPEPDQLDARVPLGLLLLSIVVLALSALLTVGVRALARREPPAGGLSLTPPAAALPHDVGTQPVQAAALFPPHAAAASTRARPAELDSFGWVDRERGLVHIPIARAKQLYLERQSGATRPAPHGDGGGQP